MCVYIYIHICVCIYIYNIDWWTAVSPVPLVPLQLQPAYPSVPPAQWLQVGASCVWQQLCGGFLSHGGTPSHLNYQEAFPVPFNFWVPLFQETSIYFYGATKIIRIQSRSPPRDHSIALLQLCAHLPRSQLLARVCKKSPTPTSWLLFTGQMLKSRGKP